MADDHKKHPFFIFASGVGMGVIPTFAILMYFQSQLYVRIDGIEDYLKKQGTKVVSEESNIDASQDEIESHTHLVLSSEQNVVPEEHAKTPLPLTIM